MDLWVLPPPTHSKWFARLDWYLNWQLCKGLAFQRARPSVELFRIVEEGSFTFVPTPEAAPSPLLVISQGRLPARKCLVVEPQETLKDWLKQIQEISTGLQAQKMRVFLPQGFSQSEATSAWQTLSTLQVQFSSDEDAL